MVDRRLVRWAGLYVATQFALTGATLILAPATMAGVWIATGFAMGLGTMYFETVKEGRRR